MRCAAIVFVMILASCRSEPATPAAAPRPEHRFPVSIVEGRDITPEDERPDARVADVAALLRQVVASCPRLVIDERASGAYRIYGEAYQAVMAADKPVREAQQGMLHAAVRVEARRGRRGDVDEAHVLEVRRQAALPADPPRPTAEAMRAAMRDAMTEALEVLSRRIEVRNGSDEEVLAALRETDARVAASAAEEAGSRKLASAVAGLLDLLGSGDDDTILAAVGALGMLKSDAAVKPLTDLTRHRNRQVRMAAAYALGDISTDSARRNLQIIEQAHPDDQIREVVKEILERTSGQD